jgi:hypothetical protein
MVAEPFDASPPHPSPVRGPELADLDADPFARLSDADLVRLRQRPAELAEELRFGSYWLADAEDATTRGLGRALEVAAEVIEGLLADRGRATREQHVERAADEALRLADAALGDWRLEPPAPSTMLHPSQATDGRAMIQAQAVAYSAYVGRLTTYLEELQALLDRPDPAASAPRLRLVDPATGRPGRGAQSKE